ncbi:MAG: hypothetical protein R2707_12940 [Acidimicrobiales bacterium]
MPRSSSRRRFLARLIAVLGVVSLFAAACGDDGDGGGDGSPATNTAAPGDATTTTTAPATTAPPPESGEQLDLQLNVVEFGDDGFVEIINTGAEPVTLAGIYICEFPDYADLGDVAEIASLEAGATLRIPAAVLGGLSSEDGEAALYAGDDFTSSDAMLSYVQWGVGEHERASVAVDAGLWPSVDVFVTPDPAFNSIESGGFAADPEGWS